MTSTYSEGAERAISWAFDHLGVPYVFGGETSAGLDCSGMTKMAWKAGSNSDVLSHAASWQWFEVAHVWDDGIGALRRGDIVFYVRDPIKRGPQGQTKMFDKPGYPDGLPGHCAIYLGWYNGYQWVVQATTYGVLSEVIPMTAYVSPIGYGRVHYGDWNHKTTTKAVYKGLHIDTEKWARYL